MKRCPQLAALSRDHHHALVLARRCGRSATVDDDVDLAAAWGDARDALARELAPHFQIEERVLLPQLAAAGEIALVDRTRREHEQLRALIVGEDTRAGLQQLGELLAAHVRFEERELFPAAERALSEVTLAAIGVALERRENA